MKNIIVVVLLLMTCVVSTKLDYLGDFYNNNYKRLYMCNKYKDNCKPFTYSSYKLNNVVISASIQCECLFNLKWEISLSIDINNPICHIDKGNKNNKTVSLYDTNINVEYHGIIKSNYGNWDSKRITFTEVSDDFIKKVCSKKSINNSLEFW